MGATFFHDSASAETADDAFYILIRKARHEYGHRSYSGTIAEKRMFQMMSPNAGESPMACITRLFRLEEHWIINKWGPAACIDAGPDPQLPDHHIYFFFGWASS